MKLQTLPLAAWLCVAGMALGNMDRHFAWQGPHVVTWILSMGGRGAVTELGDAALGDMDSNSAWQVSHLVTWIMTVYGNHFVFRIG